MLLLWNSTGKGSRVVALYLVKKVEIPHFFSGCFKPCSVFGFLCRVHCVCYRLRWRRLRRAGEHRQQTQRQTRLLRGRPGRLQEDRGEAGDLCVRSCYCQWVTSQTSVHQTVWGSHDVKLAEILCVVVLVLVIFTPKCLKESMLNSSFLCQLVHLCRWAAARHQVRVQTCFSLWFMHIYSWNQESSIE